MVPVCTAVKGKKERGIDLASILTGDEIFR